LLLSPKLSDIFTTLSVLSDSLSTGQPLPACLPKLRDRLLYHEYYKGRHRHPEKQNVQESESDEVLQGSVPEEELDNSTGKVDGSSIGFKELTLDVLTVRAFFGLS
jgi:Aromatic acid exporter family member 2